MLLAPLAALSLIAFLAMGMFWLYQKNQAELIQFQETHLPLLNQANQNVFLIEEIAHTYRDAVTANESLWMEEAQLLAERFRNNIHHLLAKSPSAEHIPLRETEEALNRYLQTANELTRNLLRDVPGSMDELNRQAEDMQKALFDLRELTYNLKNKKEARVNRILSNVQDRVIWFFIIIGSLSGAAFLAILTLTGKLSWGARKSIRQLQASVKALTAPDADFSQRLPIPDQIEFVELVESFNQFVEKLEKDYHQLRLTKEQVDASHSLLQVHAKAIEEKQKELARRNSELDESNKEKDEILSIVAHDLKNPIASQVGLADVLQDKKHPLSPEEQQECLSAIRESADKMMVIINNLILAHRFDHENVKTHTRHTDAKKMLEDLAGRYQARAEAKGQSLILQSKDELHCLADPFLLEQILDNLVSNAVKYTPMGKPIYLALEALDHKVRFVVRDTGPGLAEEERRKLFGKFTRLSPRPTGGEESSGLGLFIARKMTLAMGGRIGCESREGEGSTFYLELPGIGSSSTVKKTSTTVLN